MLITTIVPHAAFFLQEYTDITDKLIEGRIFLKGKRIAVFTSGDPNKKLAGFGGKFPIHISSFNNNGKVTIQVLAIRKDGLIGFIAD